LKLKSFIAWRYLFSRKRKSVINIISWISLVGLSIASTALIIVLSVYNGIGGLTQKLFNAFDPQLMIEKYEGKSFHADSTFLEKVLSVDGIGTVSCIVEENAWITYRQNQAIVQLRGVDRNYPAITGIDTMIFDGEYFFVGQSKKTSTIPDSQESPDTIIQTINQTIHYAVLGALVYDQLGLRSLSNDPMAVHIPKRGRGIGLSIDDAFNTDYLYLAGTFYIQQDIDSKYVLADIGFVRSLLEYSGDECTSLAIALTPKANVRKVKKELQQSLGTDYLVKDRYDQQPLYFKIYRSERFGIILILSLIVLISTLNLIASLSLLIIDKKRDIATIRSLGMERHTVRQIFFREGIFISFVGVIAGLFLGFVICFLQQTFGFIKMGNNFVVSAFPIEMHPADFLLTFVLVMMLSTLAVWFTTRRAKIQ